MNVSLKYACIDYNFFFELMDIRYINLSLMKLSDFIENNFMNWKLKFVSFLIILFAKLFLQNKVFIYFIDYSLNNFSFKPFYLCLAEGK